MIKPSVLFSVSVDNSTLELSWMTAGFYYDNASPEPTRKKINLRFLLGLKLELHSFTQLETLSNEASVVRRKFWISVVC